MARTSQEFLLAFLAIIAPAKIAIKSAGMALSGINADKRKMPSVELFPINWGINERKNKIVLGLLNSIKTPL